MGGGGGREAEEKLPKKENWQAETAFVNNWT